MNLDAVMAYEFPPVEHTYTEKDTMLYGLGLSLGRDPQDPEQLKFVYEKGLQALPSMCNVLAHPGFWLREPRLAIDWVRALHGEQRFVVHKPLPPRATVIGDMRVIGVEDKGPNKGALLFYEKVISAKSTGERLCTVQTTGFLRGDGGCGNAGVTLPGLEATPQAQPEATLDWPTGRQSALIYRLSGDLNPLHVEPSVAAQAGFQGPILQGLCTMGVACFGLIKLFCRGEPHRLRGMGVRFRDAIYPGETIRLECWRTDRTIWFRARVAERDSVVLDHGVAEMSC